MYIRGVARRSRIVTNFDNFVIKTLIFPKIWSIHVLQVKYDKNGFEVKLDVQNFTPSELEVKLAGNRLTVSGKHEQRADVHGYVAREFHREFEIPEVCLNAFAVANFRG